MKNEKMMRKAFERAANEMMYASDAQVREDVLVNTMASRLSDVSEAEVRAFVKAQLAKMDQAVSDYSFNFSM